MNTKNSEVNEHMLGTMLHMIQGHTKLNLALMRHDTRNEFALYEITPTVLELKNGEKISKVKSWDRQLSAFVSNGAMYDILDALLNVARTMNHREVEA